MSFGGIAAGVGAVAGGYLASQVGDSAGDETTMTQNIAPGPYPGGGEDLWRTYISQLIGPTEEWSFNPDWYSEEYLSDENLIKEIDADWEAYTNEFGNSGFKNKKSGFFVIASDKEDLKNKLQTTYTSDPWTYYQEVGEAMGHEVRDPELSAPKTQLDYLQGNRDYVEGAAQKYIDDTNVNARNYNSILDRINSIVTNANEERFNNPLKVSIGGKKLASVYPKGKEDAAYRLADLLGQTGKQSFAANMLVPQAEYDFAQTYPVYQPNLDYFKMISDAANAMQGYRYGAPTTTTTSQQPGASGLEQVGGWLNILGSGLDLYNKISSPTTTTPTSNTGVWV